MRARNLFILLAVCVLCAVPWPRREVWQRLRIPLDRPGAFERLLRAGADVQVFHEVDPDGGEGAAPAADVVCRATDVRRFRALGLRPRILVDDLAAAERARHFEMPAVPPAPLAATAGAPGPAGPPGFGLGSMGGAFTLAEIDSLLDHYATAYPGIVAAPVTIGVSVENRPIRALKVSDHPALAEAEPRVLFDALHHAREPMSAHALLWLLDRLVTGYGVDPALTQLIDQREIWFVPVVNPDGYAYNEAIAPHGGGMWRKNRRVLPGGCVGVDLNRNYPFQWGADDLGSSPEPCTDVFRGPAPASEPEVAALLAFAAAQSFDVACSLHAHGDLLLYPFSHSAAVGAANQALYEDLSDAMAAACGYRAGTPALLVAPGNGSALDHHHAAFGSLAWSPEIGAAFWPPPGEMAQTAERIVEPLVAMIRVAGAWIEPRSLAVAEVNGDLDGYADPGEVVELALHLKNVGSRATGGPVAIDLAAEQGAFVTVLQGHAVVPPIAAAATVATGVLPLRVRVDGKAPPGTRASLAFALSFDGFTRAAVLPLVLGTPRRILRDDAEQDLGWTLGAPGDTAITGRWMRADPNPILQGSEVAQPGDDATDGLGKACFVTGAGGVAAGMDDVDDGKTTLVSPRFDLTGALNPVVRVARFYWCSKADDPFTVDASNDGGATWVNLETLSGQPNDWRTVEWPLPAGMEPTSAMRLRFVATDPANDSVTEALIDDVEVIDFGATPRTSVFGAARPGGRVELQIAGPAGAPAACLMAPGPALAAPLTAFGLVGTLGLDPAALVVLFQQPLPSGGWLRVPIVVPDQPALIGSRASFQTIVLAPVPTAGNVTEVVIAAD